MASAQGPEAVNLDQAFLAAQKKTEFISIVESQIEQAKENETQVKAQLLPELTATANYLRQNSAAESSSKPEQSTSKLSLSQPLYSGGIWSGLSAAKLSLKAKQYDLLSEKNKLYINVAYAFYSVLSAEQDMQNIKKTIQLTGGRISELKKRTRIGKSRNIEVLAAQAQLSVLQSQLIAAQAELSRARDHFSYQTGLDRNMKIVDQANDPKLTESLESILAKIDSRPDMKSLTALRESAQYSVDVAKGGYWPSLDLSGNYYLSKTGTSQNDNRWDIGVTLTLPIYEGGSTQSKVRVAASQMQEADLLLKQRRRLIKSEIQTLYSNLQSLLQQKKSLETALAATEKNYLEQQKDYRYSLATNLDVIQALNTFQDTKRSYDHTRYQALITFAELEASLMGTSGEIQ